MILTSVYIKNSSSYNLTKFFTIHELKNCQCGIPKEINIFLFLINCLIVYNHISIFSWRIMKQILQDTNSIILFLKINFHILRNLRIKPLACLSTKSLIGPNHSCCTIVLLKFFPLVISLLNEWSIKNTAANKILGMRLMVLYKYMNCIADKTTATPPVRHILIFLTIAYQEW